MLCFTVSHASCEIMTHFENYAFSNSFQRALKTGSREPPNPQQSFEQEQLNYENWVASTKTLYEHLLEQVGETNFSDIEKKVGFKRCA